MTDHTAKRPSSEPPTLDEEIARGEARVQGVGAALILLVGTLFGDLSSAIGECRELRWLLALGGTSFLLAGVCLGRAWMGYRGARRVRLEAKRAVAISHYFLIGALVLIAVGLPSYLIALWRWAL